MKTLLFTGAAALALSTGIASANGAYLVSGSGKGSTYKNGYAPPIVEAISPITEEELFGSVQDRDGNGTIGNLETCAAETSGALCFGIGQGNLVAKSPQVQAGEVCVIRADLDAEFTFAFTNNPRLDDWGKIRKAWEAGRVTIYTSATSSGSLGTLQEVANAAGFANAKFETLPSWDAVIAKVKSDPRAIGFTHRFADPNGWLNDLVDDHGMTVTGLAERALRRQTHANGEPVYMVDNAPYDAYRLNTAVNTTVSMGTPVVLFGTCPSQYGGEAEYVQSVHDRIAALPVDELAVDLGWLASLMNNMASLGDAGWDHFDKLIENATN